MTSKELVTFSDKFCPVLEWILKTSQEIKILRLFTQKYQ